MCLYSLVLSLLQGSIPDLGTEIPHQVPACCGNKGRKGGRERGRERGGGREEKGKESTRTNTVSRLYSQKHQHPKLAVY